MFRIEFQREKGRVFALDEAGKLLAEVTFPTGADGVAEIDHTFVDSSLRGQGIAGQLLNEAVKVLRQEGKKARPVCSYAVTWFEKHPEHSDLLVES